MTLTLPEVVEALEKARCYPKQNGVGWWASCPVHDPRRSESNLFTQEDDGQVVFDCPIRCSREDILFELGFSAARPQTKQATEKASNHKPGAAHRQQQRQPEEGPDAKRQTELEKELDGYKPTTFGQVEKNVGQLTHLWSNWLVIGNLAMIWSKPKQGKTRIYIRWIKTLWFAEQWPDGAANIWPAGTKTLILPYDRNHVEIANEMRRMGIPDGAAVCPHDPSDPTGVSLLSITHPFMLAILEKCLTDDKAIKLVVVDTLTYASEKSLSKPEDMKAILDNIMTLASRHAVAVLVLIHENREGEALGRRICERARVLMKLERYSESDPTRLRLYVKESNFKEHPALTAVHTDAGIEFHKDAGQPGIAADRRDACARWLCEFLWKRGVNAEIAFGSLIDEAGRAGFAGTYDSTTNRWSDRKLFSRAIEGLNNESESLADLEHFKIKRREETVAGRGKPVIWYWLESTWAQPSGDV